MFQYQILKNQEQEFGLTGINGNNVDTSNVTVPKVEKKLPKTGGSNFKVVLGIFIVAILGGVMYVYKNKLSRITRKTRKLFQISKMGSKVRVIFNLLSILK